MQIILNGNPCSFANISTVQELLQTLDLKGRLAVEINQEIVPRSLFQTHELNPGDTVEIVHAIGGG